MKGGDNVQHENNVRNAEKWNCFTHTRNGSGGSWYSVVGSVINVAMEGYSNGVACLNLRIRGGCKSTCKGTSKC